MISIVYDNFKHPVGVRRDGLDEARLSVSIFDALKIPGHISRCLSAVMFTRLGEVYSYGILRYVAV